MNFKFKVKGFEAKMKGEGNVKVDEIEVAYEDVKLAEIPAIIKEVRKTFKDIKDMVDAENAEPEVVHHPFPFPIPVAVSEHEAMFFGQCPCEQSAPPEEANENKDELDEVFK